MSIRYRFLPDLGLVHLEINGSVSLPEIVALLEQLNSEPGYPDYPLHFTDITGLSASVFTLEDIRQLAIVGGVPAGCRRGAILAPDDLVFGLCRQFQAIRGSDISQICRSLEQALDYLEIDEIPPGGEWKTVSG